jgi:hypothetical protein
VPTVLAYAPPLAFLLSWLFAVIGWQAPGTDATTPFAEQALRWILYIALGWTSPGPEAWIAASIAGGVFLLFAGLNHILEIVRDKNYRTGQHRHPDQ